MSGLFSVVQVFDPRREVGIILPSCPPSSPPSSPFPHISPHSQLSLTNFTLSPPSHLPIPSTSLALSSLPPPHPFNLTRSLLPPTSPFLQHHTLSPLSHLICLLVDPNQPVFCCICLIQVLQPNILVANLHISCPIVPRWAGVVNLCIVGVTHKEIGVWQVGGRGCGSMQPLCLLCTTGPCRCSLGCPQNGSSKACT